jgi:hypothetical protein
VVTRLRADNGNCDSILSVGKSFSLLTGSGTHSDPLFNGPGSKEAGGGGELEDKSHHLAQSSAWIKSEQNYTSTPAQYLHGVQTKKG